MAQVKDPMTGSDELTAREIRDNIRRTRAQMDNTVDAIEEKLTPGELVHEAWSLVRGGSSSSIGRVLRIAKQHPLPATIISLGLGWMVYESATGHAATGRRYAARYAHDERRPAEDEEPSVFESARERAGAVSRRATDAADSAIGKASNLAAQTRETANEVASSARSIASDTVESVRRQTSDLGRQASELGEQARHGLRQAQSGFWRTLEEQPLIVGAATVAAGLLVGLLLPSSSQEDELMGRTRDALVDEVTDLGHETLQKGRQVASAAADTLTRGAEARSLSADAVVEKVRTVGREVVEAVKDEAQKQHLTPDALADKGRPAPRETSTASESWPPRRPPSP
jgi:hypothetical protein